MVEIIPNWHPIFVHFSVALLVVSAILFVLTKLATNWRLEDQWLATAYWNLWLGTLVTVGTVIAGWVAFNSVKHDDPSHAAMLTHRLWTLATAGTFLVLAIWGVFQYRSQKRPSIVFVVAMVAGGLLLLTAAWHGGELVYRHGLGVKSLPNLDHHTHSGGGEEGAASHHDDGSGMEAHEHGEAGSNDHHDEMGATDHPHDDGLSTPATGGETSTAPEATTAPIGGDAVVAPTPSQ